MEDNLKQELIELGGKYFSGLKSTWTGTDLQNIYRLYNAITGQNKQDTGCNSCRRESINFVRDEYMRILKTTKQSNV
jgi:hypothetical protein